MGNLGKIIVATCFEWLPKVKKNRPIWSHCVPCFFYLSQNGVNLLRLLTPFCSDKPSQNSHGF